MINRENQRQALDTLLDIAESREQQFLQFATITKEQGKFIAEEDMDALFESVETRNICIKNIEKLDNRFAPLYKKIQELYENGALVNECISLYNRLQLICKRYYSIVKETYRKDKANLSNLEDVQRGYAEEIKKIKQGARRQKAYRPHVSIDGGIFIDQKQ